MYNDALFYDLALSFAKGIGPVNTHRLLNHFGSSKELFCAQRKKLLRSGVNTKLIDAIRLPDNLRKAEKELKFMESHKIFAIRYSDKEYPKRLKHCHDAPFLLFSKRKLNINKKRILSIVGTRNMTLLGKHFLTNLMHKLKKYDPVIISGLAYGADICAHREAVKNGLSTIGVLAHGFDTIYPKPHYNTALEMLENGNLYTEFTSGTKPEKSNFIKRNRIIAGLSEATLVVESAQKGGSLITADMAFSYDREVFAVPGRPNDIQSAGCNKLIKENKASLCSNEKDLAVCLGWEEEAGKLEHLYNVEFESMDNDERRIHSILLETDRMDTEDLSHKSGLEIKDLLSKLLEMELKGLVLCYPGKVFEAIRKLN
ncbi:DNA-processing protein DprA [Lutimonas saemankumensis]|uniref:DNA-processing protein DprA n=1 Tax=Lutimonas saemankumensis TaxID=483016 RepID=UPI001CD555C9|nr:DNA-processing protein DprA [Lutimonas saemankumensis]MCA0933025.1 DNA-processing protein DprA [Lutimonas saemankumensis]